MNKISIVDVAIIRDGKLLMVQERKQSAYGLWNFPGGKVEEGETLERAACREIKEELNVELIDATFLKTYPYQIPGIKFDLNVFIGNIKGDIKIKDDEIMDWGWFSLLEIENMKDKLRGLIILEQAHDAIETITRRILEL
jgi:mutator protein MutT